MNALPEPDARLTEPTRSIRLLHLEDDPRDADLIRLKLEASGLRCEVKWVVGKDDFESALDEQTFDLVLSDYKLPGYGGLAALGQVREKRPELPVIIISGGLSEEEAVDCLKAGATDYVLKQRPQRLEAAIRRALVERDDRAALRRAEEEISRQNIFLRQVIDLNPNYIFAKDREGRFVLVNQAVAQAYGSTVEELTGQKVGDVTSDSRAVSTFLGSDIEAMETRREVVVAEEKIVDAGGVERWLQTVKRPIVAADGSCDLVLGVAVDITERKRADDAIRGLNAQLEQRVRDRTAQLEAANRAFVEANSFLDSVIENMPDMVFVKYASDLRYVRFNHACEELMACSRADVLGKTDYDLVSKEEADFFRSKDLEVLERGVMVDIAEESLMTPNKGRRILHTRKIPVFDQHGQTRYLLGISEDVTQAKEKEQEIRGLNAALEQRSAEAEAATRAKSTFLATMSHEIRTPMNGIFGLLELLSLTSLDPDQRTTLEMVRNSSRSLLRIIDDILDFSKIEAGKLEVRHEVASIRQVIDDVRNMYSGVASSKGVLLKASVDPAISPALLADPLRIRQILNNFLSNALKFTSQGAIEIRAELIERANAAERIRFSVEDSGIGISPENQKQLFQPFSQGDPEASRRAGGTGLGLTICRRLAELMGGSVEMVSELGKGTTMLLTLSLPIGDPRDVPKADLEKLRDLDASDRAAPSIAQAEASGTLVLLVDDHPINRMLLLRQVTALGYAAESAEDGAQALALWKTGRFGIVVTDCNMPEMDGYELARSIRRLEAAQSGQRTPIIACTANAMGSEAQKCFEAGMDDYLVKPAGLSQLCAKLEQWLPGAKEGDPLSGKPELAGAKAPVDLSLIEATLGNEAASLREFLLVFKRTGEDDAAVLRRAVAAGDFAQVLRVTHRMIGAGKMIGAADFVHACERLHDARPATGTGGDALADQMAAFEREWSRLDTYIQAF